MPSSSAAAAERPLADLVRAHAEARPDANAYLWSSTRMSWAEYDASGTAIAERLAGEGIVPGDRVLVWLPDGGGVHAAFLGCERAGAVAVGVGWRAGVRELAALTAKTRPRHCITARDTPLGPATGALADLSLPILELLDLDGSPRPAEGPAAAALGQIGVDDLWLLNSTSGTTGLPKCVQQHQRRWMFFHDRARAFAELGPSDRIMSVVPAPFGFGLWTSHFTPTLLGVPCSVQPRFDARAAAEAIVRDGITVLCAVSSQFVMILEAAEDLDLSGLRILFTGGERLPVDRCRAFEASTGCTVLNFYGSNETGMLSGTRLGDPLELRISTGGRCIPEMDVRLYDDAGRRRPGDIGVGLPACRGPACSHGYYDDDAANAELFTEDGWMRMGDFVEIDALGWLRVIGRAADFIVRGGKNLSAGAIEEEVSTHPAVAEVAAVAVPNERLGEIVGVCVALRPGKALDLAGLKRHLGDRGVTKEWWPERLAVLEAMPRSSGGKIAKGALRDRIAELFPEA